MSWLIRERDGEGYSGSRVEAIDPVSLKVVAHEPTVGCALLVGTITAGMFTKRDWWFTTPITEIVEETAEEVKFKTKNSTYTFRK